MYLFFSLPYNFFLKKVAGLLLFTLLCLSSLTQSLCKEPMSKVKEWADRLVVIWSKWLMVVCKNMIVLIFPKQIYL